MKLLIEPRLMERVVFDAVRADSAFRPEFERQRSACYGQPAERRERAFAELHETWFRRLGFQAALESMTADHPLLAANVDRLIVSTAAHARDQGVELFGDAGRRVLTLRIHPTTLRLGADFERWAAHELTYADDMFDPGFAYDRTIRPSGPNVASANLARERYAVLWALSIDARLSRGRALPAEWTVRRRSELLRVFGLEAEGADVFDSLWREFQTTRPTHAALVDRAQSGCPLAPTGDDRATAGRQSRPGSICPICGFSTFTWADLRAQPDVVTAVSASFSSWEPAAGLCARCGEVYRSARSTSLAGGTGPSA